MTLLICFNTLPSVFPKIILLNCKNMKLRTFLFNRKNDLLESTR